MRVLLDTHVFLWSNSETLLLSEAAESILLNPDTVIHLSIATFWEIGIKLSIGKLNLDMPIRELYESAAAEATILPITLNHIQRIAELPFQHRDPLDQMLVAQAVENELVLVSRDSAFDAYGVAGVW